MVTRESCNGSVPQYVCKRSHTISYRKSPTRDTRRCAPHCCRARVQQGPCSQSSPRFSFQPVKEHKQSVVQRASNVSSFMFRPKTRGKKNTHVEDTLLPGQPTAQRREADVPWVFHRHACLYIDGLPVHCWKKRGERCAGHMARQGARVFRATCTCGA